MHVDSLMCIVRCRYSLIAGGQYGEESEEGEEGEEEGQQVILAPERRNRQ